MLAKVGPLLTDRHLASAVFHRGGGGGGEGERENQPPCTSPTLSIFSDPPVSATPPLSLSLSLSVPVTSIKIPAVDEPLFRAIVRRF